VYGRWKEAPVLKLVQLFIQTGVCVCVCACVRACVYPKTVYVCETATKIRPELNFLHITEENFHQWKEESFNKAMHRLESPPENILRR